MRCQMMRIRIRRQQLHQLRMALARNAVASSSTATPFHHPGMHLSAVLYYKPHTYNSGNQLVVDAESEALVLTARSQTNDDRVVAAAQTALLDGIFPPSQLANGRFKCRAGARINPATEHWEMWICGQFFYKNSNDCHRHFITKRLADERPENRCLNTTGMTLLSLRR